MSFINFLLQDFYLLILLFSVLGCKSPNEPIDIKKEWENITYNIQGEKLRDIKEHNKALYLSTYNSIYTIENNIWKEYINVSPQFIADFEFKSDTLFILTMNNKILYKNDNDSLIVKYSIDRSFLPANDLCFYEKDVFIGGRSQGPFRNGLTEFEVDSSYSYTMNNYNVPYDVNRIERHGNSIFIGTLIAGSYFVAKLDNGILESIGLNENRYGIGECYSMISYNEKLLVGSGGEVLAYENNQWSIYKKKIPTIQNTELEDKAISLFAKDTTLFVGTMYNGLLVFDNNSNEWKKYFSNGLPEKQSINKIVCIDNILYVLIGQYNFDDTFSNFIYKIAFSNLDEKSKLW